jgi:hypothetical protein
VEEDGLSPDEAKGRADHAQRLLDDSMLKESFDLAETALVQALRVAKTESEAFKATIAFQVFEMIRDSIKTHIATGKIIEYNLKDRTLLDKISGR